MSETRADDAKPSADVDPPSFLAGFPKHPELDALVAAFVRGDYARVRAEAPRLADRAESDEVRAAARELARRIEPDPVSKALLLLAIALLVALAGWYFSHRHGAT